MRRALFALILLAFCSLAEAATRYVDATPGANCTANYSIVNRACNGTDGNSYTTIIAGIAVTVAGDTLNIRTGTYAEVFTTVSDTLNAGTSYVNAVTIQAYNSELVTWRGSGATGALTINGTGGTFRYIIFSGITWDGQNANSMVYVGGPVDHIRFTGNTFNGNSTFPTPGDNVQVAFTTGFGGSVPAVAPDSLEFINNTVSNTGNHCIYIGGSTNALVEGNTVSNCGYYGIHLYTGDAAAENADGVISKNVVSSVRKDTSRSSAAGIIASGSRIRASNNLVYLGTSTGVEGIIVAFGSANNVKLLNNTVYGHTGEIGIHLYSGTSSATVTNNISYLNGTNYTDEATGTTAANNSTDGTNPNFVDTTNFRLQATSACCLDNGTNLTSTFTDDRDGQSRPSAGGWDIGSDEFIAADSPPAGCVGGAETITFDAASTGSGSAVSTLTVAHTITGTNTYTIAAVGVEKAATVTGVTCAGASMSLILRRAGTDASAVATEMWGRAACATGNVVVTLDVSSIPILVGIISFTGVHQTTSTGTAVGPAGGGYGTSSTINATSATGELVVDAVFQETAEAMTPGAGQTERYELQAQTTTLAGTTEAGGATVTMSQSWATSGYNAQVAVPLKPASTVCSSGGAMLMGMVGN